MLEIESRGKGIEMLRGSWTESAVGWLKKAGASVDADPAPDDRPRGERVATAISALLAVAVLSILLLSACWAPRFGVDSWSYLELSNTVFGDFYRTNTLRQFELDTPYGSAFPPLWPIMIAIVRKAWDLGIYTGGLLNFFVAIALVGASIQLMRRLGAAPAAGPVVVLCLLSIQPIADDLMNGGNTLFTMLLLTGLSLLLIRPELTPLQVVAGGLTAGLAAITRFDVLPTLLLMGAFAVVRGVRGAGSARRVTAAACFFAPMCLVIAPWSAYCYSRFDRLLASDNTRQLTSAAPGHVLDFHEQPPANDLTQRPTEWLRGFVSRKAPASLRSLVTGAYASFLPVLLLFVVAAWGNHPLPISSPLLRFAVGGLLLAPGILLPACLVGYATSRYFAALYLWLIIGCLVILSSQLRAVWKRPQIVLPLLFIAAPLVYQNAVKPVLAVEQRSPAPLRPTEQMSAVAQTVRRDAATKPYRLLYMHDAARTNRDGAKYGALTGEPTSLTPHNVDDRLAAFIRAFGITHVYDPANMRGTMDLNGVMFVPLEVSGLFRISTIDSK